MRCTFEADVIGCPSQTVLRQMPRPASATSNIAVCGRRQQVIGGAQQSHIRGNSASVESVVRTVAAAKVSLHLVRSAENEADSKPLKLGAWYAIGLMSLAKSYKARSISEISSSFEFPMVKSLDSFRILPHVGTLAAAYALAVPIGWDRESAERSAGLRTFPLVAVAACGFVQATETMLAHHPEGAARIVEGLITGIGFIGGGAIVKHGTSVLGTATAASLWATGAVGAAVGLGAFDVAVVIAGFTFLTLRFVSERSPKTTGSSTGADQSS